MMESKQFLGGDLKYESDTPLDESSFPIGNDVSSKGVSDSYFKSPPKNCFDSIIKEPSKRSVKKVIEATIPTAKDKERNIRRSCPDLNSLRKIFVANKNIVIRLCHQLTLFFDRIYLLRKCHE